MKPMKPPTRSRVVCLLMWSARFSRALLPAWLGVTGVATVVVVPFRLIVVDPVAALVVGAVVVVPALTVVVAFSAAFDFWVGLAWAAWACSARWRACWTAAGSWSWNFSAALVLPTAERSAPRPNASGPRTITPTSVARIRCARPAADRNKNVSGTANSAKPSPNRIEV
jgi:hypothetical protein